MTKDEAENFLKSIGANKDENSKLGDYVDFNGDTISITNISSQRNIELDIKSITLKYNGDVQDTDLAYARNAVNEISAGLVKNHGQWRYIPHLDSWSLILTDSEFETKPDFLALYKTIEIVITVE